MAADAWTAWAAEILAFSGLADFQHRLVDNLSGGMSGWSYAGLPTVRGM